MTNSTRSWLSALLHAVTAGPPPHPTLAGTTPARPRPPAPLHTALAGPQVRGGSWLAAPAPVGTADGWPTAARS
jgi:hypothetical protein